MNKTKRTGAVHVDDRLPKKPSASPAGKPVTQTDAAGRPSQDGPSKSDKAPAPRRGAVPAKPPTEKISRPRAAAKQPDFGDQVPSAKGQAAGAAGAGEQYIRLRIRVRGSKLTVLDSHLVDGPLSQAQGFSTPNVYEITSGDRLLHAGELPDLGMQRSFVDPAATPEQGHHFTERPIYEFTARVPANEVTRETLPTIAVRVHRIKEEARTGRLGLEPLAAQFPREVRQVAELIGLPASVLPEAIEARGGRTPSI
jgi:hypothetical protein